MATKQNLSDKKIILQREFGVISSTAYVVGNIIGSGIFISPRYILLYSGSVGMSLVVWCICGVVAMIGGMVYAELGVVVKESGGEYKILKAGFSDLHPFWGPLPAFLYAFMAIVILAPSSLVIVTSTCARYIISMFADDCSQSETAEKCLAAFILLTLAYINCVSVRGAAYLMNACTFAKTAALLIIITGGIVNISQGRVENFSNAFENTSSDMVNLFLSLYSGFWAYGGWSSMNSIVEEVRHPDRNLPVSIIAGVSIVIFCYVLTNISYLTAMSPQQLVQSPAVALTWAEHFYRPLAIVILLGVAISTFGAANGSILGGGRLYFVAARDGQMMKSLATINVFNLTPIPAICILAISAIIFMIPSNISQLINLMGFSTWLIYGMTMVAFFILRRSRKNEKKSFKVPLVFPIFLLLVSIFLVIIPIILDPRIEMLFAIGFLLFGIVIYAIFVYYKYEIPCMRYFTMYVQLLMQSTPQEHDKEGSVSMS